MRERLLVTGADGYVGRLLVRHLLAAGDDDLLLWTRARDTASALDRLGGTVTSRELASGRVRLAGGDLRDPDPFARVDPAALSGIVHLAAVTSFAVSAVDADAVNRAGTGRVLELAGRCTRLRSLVLASTVYASGLRTGAVEEAPLDSAAGFANEYERSKWRAEQLTLGAGLDVPVAVLRLSTVAADDSSGMAGTHNAVHNTLALLRHGLLSLMPGDPATPLYLVTGDLVASALQAAVRTRASGFVHVAHRAQDSLTLGEAVRVALEVFSADPGFRARGVRPPRFADLTAFGLLAEGVGSFGGGVLGQALGSLLPFARQLYVPKQVGNDALRRLLPGYRPDDAAAVFAATCEALLRREGSRVPA